MLQQYYNNMQHILQTEKRHTVQLTEIQNMGLIPSKIGNKKRKIKNS